MGIIKVAVDSARKMFSDQWLEYVKPADLGEGVIASIGKVYNNSGSPKNNSKRTPDTISNGSYIMVPEDTCMILVDNGKIVDYTTEAGNYKVENSSLPSLFNSNIGPAVKDMFTETWKRFKFAGTVPTQQQVVYINMRPINDIKFGTPTPVPYYDANYDVDLEVKSHGSYSIEVVEPLRFFIKVLAADVTTYTLEDFNDQYRNEFIEKFSVALTSLSAQNIRISQLMMHGSELSALMADKLDDSWRELRGMEILTVAVASITYSEKSAEILEIRNKGSVLRDASIRQGYVQGAIARGIESAGSNEAGAGVGMMGVGLGMNAGGNMMGQASQANFQEMQMQEQARQQAEQNLQQHNQQTANQVGQGQWTCPQCQTVNEGKFCTNCGTKKPEEVGFGACGECGYQFKDSKPKFCPNCGKEV